MYEPLLIRFLGRARPPFGWLPFLLLAGSLGALAFSVLEVGWVANDGAIAPLLAGGFIGAAMLARRRIPAAVAWAALLLAGLALTIILVGQLTPPPGVLFAGRAAVADFWQIRAALLVDRAAGWYAAVSSGGRSTETIVFALALGLAAWGLAAALAWSVYRARRPFLGLTPVVFAVAANTFYGRASLYWAVICFGLAVCTGVFLHYLLREAMWERESVDYSTEVRGEVLAYTAGISLGVLALAVAIPSINFRALADVFQRQEAVLAAEQTVARVFAGVVQPRQDEGAAGAGGMPRSFLLGAAPELMETVVMTATLAADPPVDLSGYHWRSVSFDVYTGGGWLRSAEREETFVAGQAIPQPVGLTAPVVHVTQQVDWIYDRRATRYTLGRPLVFSHDVVASWRGLEDLVGLRGTNNAPLRYAADTAVLVPAVEQLRAARLEDAPSELRARYTELPRDTPERVRQLAAQITAAADGQTPLTAYDKARAIEAFLHQYEYSLDLPAPPADVDIVDYFLFDLQKGFCDYFASAMVVLARSAGLPARLGVGFLQQPPDAAGVQTVRQANAHSWAEIYFAGVGWVEFEPTPPFAAAQVAVVPAAAGQQPPPTYSPGGAAVAVPPRAPRRDVPWLALLGLLALALVGWRLWGARLRRALARTDPTLDAVQLSYARLQAGAAAMGQPPHPAQTPAEFAADLLDSAALDDPRAALPVPAVLRLAVLFAERQYGDRETAAREEEARESWAAVAGPLRRLVWRRRFGRSH